MTNEILKDEILKEEQLDQIAGSSNNQEYPIGAPEPFISIPIERKIDFTIGEPKEYSMYQNGAPVPFISIPIERKIDFTTGEPKEYPIGAPEPFISIPIQTKI